MSPSAVLVVAAALGEHRGGGAHIAHEAPQGRLVIGDDDLDVDASFEL